MVKQKLLYHFNVIYNGGWLGTVVALAFFNV